MEREGHGFKEMLNDEIPGDVHADKEEAKKPRTMSKEEEKDSEDHAPRVFSKSEKIEETSPKEVIKTKKNVQEKINFLPLEVSLNKELKPFITEWKQQQGKKAIIFSKTETSELINWILKEKATDISAKEYNKLQDIYLEMTADSFPNTKQIELETQKKEQEEKDAQEMSIVQEKIHRAIMNEATDINEIQTQLELHRKEIKQNYGISFDEFNTPATPADAKKIEDLLALSESEVETKKTFWGKIKDVFRSNESRKNAQNFRKDFDDYLRITKELPEKIQMKTTGGTLRRSMIREGGTEYTSVGTIETTRHTPLKQESPKRRGRPKKVKRA
jgi:hypothetical protein